MTVGDMVKGDVYEGNDIWYKLKNESFIWSGGVAELIPEDTPASADGEDGPLLRGLPYRI